MRSLPDLLHSRNQTALLDALTDKPPVDAGERFFHDDLQHMLAAALWREFVTIHLHLALEQHPHPWWIERDRHIRRELYRRGCQA